MTTTAFDFSDIIFTNDERPRALPGLSETDTAIVRWLRRLVASREDGSLEVEYVAWFLARLLTNGGVLVWLGQERELLDSGLRDILVESAALVPEPWSSFLHWAGQPGNAECFQSWPTYTSHDNLDNLDSRPRRVDRQRKATPRRRR